MGCFVSVFLKIIKKVAIYILRYGSWFFQLLIIEMFVKFVEISSSFWYLPHKKIILCKKVINRNELKFLSLKIKKLFFLPSPYVAPEA